MAHRRLIDAIKMRGGLGLIADADPQRLQTLTGVFAAFLTQFVSKLLDRDNWTILETPH